MAEHISKMESRGECFVIIPRHSKRALAAHQCAVAHGLKTTDVDKHISIELTEMYARYDYI